MSAVMVRVGPTQWLDAREVAAVTWSRSNGCPVATLKSNGIVPMEIYASTTGHTGEQGRLVEAAVNLLAKAVTAAETAYEDVFRPWTPVAATMGGDENVTDRKDT